MAARVEETRPVGIRLDDALAEAARGAEGPERAALAELWLGGPDGLSAGRERGAAARRASDALALDAAMPVIADPSVLHGERVLMALSQIARALAADGEADPAALAIVDEEIAKYRLLLGLQNALVEA